MVPYEILSPKAEKMSIIGPASDGRSYGRAELSGTMSGFSKRRFRPATMIRSSSLERSEPTATAMTATQAWQIVRAVAARVDPKLTVSPH
jgi:hypothetical protein